MNVVQQASKVLTKIRSELESCLRVPTGVWKLYDRFSFCLNLVQASKRYATGAICSQYVNLLLGIVSEGQRMELIAEALVINTANK